jgi:hypothetical protein
MMIEIGGAARRLAGPLLALVLFGWAATAAADGWGGLVAGVTTRREVETRYGRPTRERAVTEAGRTGTEWTYASERAPQGLDRLVVSFGLLRRSRFEADVVRSFALYPKPRAFTVTAITNGWGTPSAIGTDQSTGRPAFRYDSKGMGGKGTLLVVLDPTGEWAEMLMFAPEPQ